MTKSAAATASKLDYVERAASALRAAHNALVDASSDLGTPEQVDDARALTRLALGRCNDLLHALGRNGK